MSEEKVISPEAVEMQRRADEMERQIVRFTNIDNESFTHSFRGISITVAKGHSYVGRLPECDHLATHLARKIISRQKKAEIPAERLGNLWNDKEIADMKTRILSAVGTDDTAGIGAEQARARDVADLEKRFDKLNPPTQVNREVSKKDIVLELERRGIKADVSKSKEDLLQQLMETEAQGMEPLVPEL